MTPTILQRLTSSPTCGWWACPNPKHSRRNDVQRVIWSNGKPYCTIPGCPHSNLPKVRLPKEFFATLSKAAA